MRFTTLIATLALTLAAALPGLGGEALAQDGYTFYDLGPVYGFAGGEGRVVGPVYAPPGKHAFVWTPDGGMVDLGTLPGGTTSRVLSGGPGGVVYGVSNCCGEAIENPYSWVAAGGMHVFSWTATGGMVDLGALFPGETNLSVRKANSSGQIVGTFGDSSWPHAFSWTPAGGGVDLDPILRTLRPDAWMLGSTAVAVSEQGEVVGLFWTQNYPDPWNAHAFIWTAEGGVTELSPFPVYDQTPYPPSSAPTDVDHGQVIGQCGGNVGFQRYAPGFAWTATDGMVDIGTLGWPSGDAVPWRVRDGQFVGFGMTATGANHAFLGTAEDGIVDLHPDEWAAAGFPWSVAVDVRDGRVAGHRYSPDGRSHAVLWTSDGEPHDLHPCGWRMSFSSPYATIDEIGTIVINGYDSKFSALTGVYVPGGSGPLSGGGPTITSTAPPRTLATGAAADPCSAELPDLTPEVVVSACGPTTIAQVPAPGTLLGEGVHEVTFTVTGEGGATATGSTTITVLPPGLVVVFLPPIDGDATNRFRHGSTIPIKIALRDCHGRDVTAEVGPSLIVTLDVQEVGAEYTPLENDVPEDYNGLGEAEARFRLVGRHFQYNLATAVLPSGPRHFLATARVVYASAPLVVVGSASAKLEGR